jgi:hypothetical protein
LLRWAAVCHYNTDNPHVHIVVRGLDKRGAEVRIDRRYMSEGLRLRGQELATNELGPRTELEMRRQTSRDITAERLTTLDRRLAEHVSAENTLETRSIANAKNISRADALARLATLEGLRLAERVSSTSWRLADGWQEVLRSLGERGDIIKRIHRALGGQPVSHRVFEPREGAQIEGVVRQKGMHDEISGEPYAVIQTPRGEAVYVRLDQATAATLKEQTAVRLSCERQPWVKATDEVLEREAASNGGIYSPTAHLEKVRRRPPMIEGRWVRADEVIAVNLRRLERLERYKLVSRRPDGTWLVPRDLVSTLRQREQTHPRLRLVVEPLTPAVKPERRRGPSLDR